MRQRRPPPPASSSWCQPDPPHTIERSRAAFTITNGMPCLTPAAAEALSKGQEGCIPTVGDWVQAVVQRKAGTKPAIAPTYPEKNPFSKASWNLAEQMRLQRKDPALAATLKAKG